MLAHDYLHEPVESGNLGFVGRFSRCQVAHTSLVIGESLTKVLVTKQRED